MKLYTAAALACFLLGGCSPAEPSIPDLVGTAPPLGDLQGVHLRVQASTIAERRPGAVVAPYGGYQESLDGYHITYHFPRTTDRPPSGKTQMQRLTARKAFADSTLAVSEWRDLVAATTSKSAQSPTCYQMSGNNEGRIESEAQWVVKTSSLVWKYVPKASADNDSSLVILQLFPAGEKIEQGEKVTVACP